MSKAKRLNEMMMMVNRKKRFTVGELAQEFGVSKRTVLRDLQELSELGVPLYSETGPHGGYQVLNERILPPIAFSENEAISIFFAIHALRHYMSLPFDAQYDSIKKKFYLNLAGDIRETIDSMKDRVDFYTAYEQKDEIPFLRVLLEAAVQQNVLLIKYETNDTTSERTIQPIGIYANQGKWYCPAYCFLREDYRMFRCDRIMFAELDENTVPIDLSEINLKNRFSVLSRPRETLELSVELTTKGVERYGSLTWPYLELHVREDGSGILRGGIAPKDIDFFSDFFISFGREAVIQKPSELIERTKKTLFKMVNQYAQNEDSSSTDD
ncbi:helix-turn-helix transcriptional regulator [Bacillus swezeyi]|uniref:helix-turn-helix transcriptional regulator n=1 Tax=Bacillus swezeyi TaxID=1925020 RepID=UPI0012390346|nr:YafY family protein [Bacillus swezeyi]KAA6474008.1 YafY family transcriptional regulator [Bacillus swezeyi]